MTEPIVVPTPSRGERGRENAARLARHAGPVLRGLLAVLRQVRVGELGVAFSVGGLVCLIAGSWLGWFELRLVGYACLLVMVVALLFLLGRTEIDARVSIEPERVTVGEVVSGQIDATNTAARPLLPITLELPIGAEVARFGLPLLGPRAHHEELFVVPTHRRGVFAVGPLRTTRTDPLGVLRRELAWTDVIDVYVRPRVISLASLGAGFLRDLEGVTSVDLSASDLSFHALREYAPGDDLRHVHWRASAKAQQLLVRQYLDTRRSHATLIVDSLATSYAVPGGDFETAMSIAASIALQALRDEFEVSFVSGKEATTGGRGPEVLDAFCRAELDDGADLIGRAQRASQMAPDTSLLVFVTGSGARTETLRRAADCFPSEVRRIAVIIDAASRPTVRTIDDLTVVTLSLLEELPSTLAWSLR